MRREATDLDVHVLPAPEKRNSRQPVLLFDCLAGPRPIFGRQYPRRRRELRTGNFASDGARRDSHLGIIPDALVLPGIAASHHVKLVVLFSKPYRSGYGGPALANGVKANIFLALDYGRDRHRDIVREWDLRSLRLESVGSSLHFRQPKSEFFHSRDVSNLRQSRGRCAVRLGTLVTAYVAREAAGVLQARHAQMDERAPEASQKAAGESRN